MQPEQNDFESLRRLLALKRHEQPPPGYFDDFSRQVVARIRAGEQGEESSLFARLGWPGALQRLWALLEAKPAYSAAVGLAACGLVMFGVLSAIKVESPVVGLPAAGTAAPRPDSARSAAAIAALNQASATEGANPAQWAAPLLEGFTLPAQTVKFNVPKN